MKKLRALLSGPRRRWLFLAGSALALVAVILVVSALMPQKEVVSDDTREISFGERAAKFVDAAEEAERSGDTTAAVALLEEAVKVDPDNTQAKTKLRRLKDGVRQTRTDPVSSDPSGGDGSGDDPPNDDDPPSDPATDPDEGFAGETEDIRTLLPASIPGYNAGTVVADEENATLAYDPTFDGPYGVITRLLVSVHDRGTPGAATAFVDDVSKVAYSKSGESVTADGVPAYFGTDGARLASVSYARGRYSFEMVMTSAGVEPEALKTLLLDAAKAFPDELP